jgi:succinate-semialdehyde dehydrogenase / glutarate-semialdehyde dehydrogenase
MEHDTLTRSPMNMIFKKFPAAALIDGEWVTSARTFPVNDPATGAEVANVPDLGAKDAIAAIDAAALALPTWSAKTAKERAAILRRWFDLIMAETESLARLMTTEQGKPLAEARAEVAYGAAFIEWFAEEGKRAYGRTIPTTVASKRYLTIKQPIGVCAAITPWNFPIAMITRKVAPALAAGCTLMVKPAEETPLCALAIAKLGQDAGLPAGVLNIVTTKDAPAVGKVFCEDERVRKLSFTGSTEVGKILYWQCANTVKKLTLELGGNAPLVVFDDADLDQAVAGAMASKYRNAGQTCVCANRILVQSGIYDRFAAALVAAVKKLKVGSGLETGVTIGPLITSDAIAKVERLVGDAVKKGAKVLVGGRLDNAGPLFYQPSVVGGVTPDMKLVREEIFGPVAALVRFDTEANAIRLANDTPFGLAAYLFSQNLSRAWRVAEKLDAGMVGVNEGIFSNEVVPFGGVKESGIGREGAAEGLDEYLQTKYICLGAIEALSITRGPKLSIE